ETRAVNTAHIELAAALRRWDLVADGPVIDTPSGCVAFVMRGAERCVVKVIGPASDELEGIGAYAHYAGRGAVRRLARGGSALRLERIAPGSALTERVTAGDDDGATVVLCGVMERLHAAGPPMKSFATVEQWGESFARLPRDTGALPADLLDRAASLYGELWRSQGPRVLLHGDLHHDNVLDGGLRGWLAIDPKGII